MYRFGYYVETDFAAARTMYFKAYDILNRTKGNKCMGDICKRIGDVFAEGIGVKPEIISALKYYQRAEVEYYEQIKSGDPWASKYIDYCIRRQSELRNALVSELNL